MFDLESSGPNFWGAEKGPSQLAFYVNLHRAVIGPSATLTGRWRPDIDLRRILTGFNTFDQGLVYAHEIRYFW